MILKGRLTISRPTGPDGDHIRITLEDNESGVRFVTAELDLATFAQAITGLGGATCELDLRGLENIGKKREVKTEILPRPQRLWNDNKANETAARAHVAPYEVDGWRCHHLDELFNSHRWVGEDQVSVTFIRFVPRKEEVIR